MRDMEESGGVCGCLWMFYKMFVSAGSEQGDRRGIRLRCDGLHCKEEEKVYLTLRYFEVFN